LKQKIEIKNIDGSVLFSFKKKNNSIKDTLERAIKEGADLTGADLICADLRGAKLMGTDLTNADLTGANLRGAKEEHLPTDWVNQCSRDMLFIFEHLKHELPFLRKKLVEGHIDGSQYDGPCACLIGSLANAKKQKPEELCNSIPFYEMGLHNFGEQWFFQIQKGDTPENSFFAKHAVELIDSVLFPKESGM
jgi:hypothetical protein